MLSNTKIDKLGKEIRKNQKSLSDEILNDLQNFRVSHKDSLSNVFNELVTIKKKFKKSSIITFRIKRFESILGKLLFREKKMKLSRMWDIAGCRVIVKNNEEVYKYRDEILKKLDVRKETDYILKPKKNGYKSIHLYVNSAIDNRVVEIQIRNQQDHNWATLVEISDLLFNSKLKEFNEDPVLSWFHLLLSKEKPLKISELKELSKILVDYKYIEKLSSVFNRNYLKVREQWLLIENKYRHKFFLIESSKDIIPQIEAFDNFNNAEKRYFEKYESNQKSNIVLTHIPKPTYEQISIAYSNYLLTMHSFLDDFIELYEKLIIESLKNNKYFDFIKYLNLYNDINLSIFTNLTKEALHSNEIAKGLPPSVKKKILKKQKEWKKEITKNIRNYNHKLNKFKNVFNSNLPTSFYKILIIKNILKYINWRFNKKISKNYAKLMNEK